MNYDTMTAHELVTATYYADRKDLDNIEPILRKAVIREASVGECEWVENEDGMWETSCDNAFVFEEDGPEENGQKFCCYCGKPLKEVPFIYPTEEETP